MGEPAVPAPDEEMPAADGQVMGPGDMAVPAGGILDKFPLIITADPDIFSFLTDVLDTGDENPCRPAVIADNPGLVGYGSNDLVCCFFTMVAVRGVSH